ncbi:glycosyltransferase family 2 protein [Sphingomonas sp. RHCKR47]|uniref:glycosyltransferase family 2 protein n=1 Tax=Sphingomonas citricola TaxID=2862498 RepID=UPI001C675F8B|nr:glycosyltransferase family 2 protein [Sphingomonas citricola]MBW6525049.1 glycosyltransferase family 2 protein [Sphingomonas citricola]
MIQRQEPFGFTVQHAAPALSIVAPAYNERENIRPLVHAVAHAMGETSWELIIVDDDSPDGTAREVAVLAGEGAPVRCIRRIDRRGLASAVVEGVLAATSELVAVIDADLQHDETRLPVMLGLLETTDVDLVIGSRHVAGGGVGEWDQHRQRMSRVATWIAHRLAGVRVSDPMSGFFVVRRSVVEAAIYDLSQQGYKILLDILTASPRPLRVAEVGYVFRERHAGTSKLDVVVLIEYAFLLIDKLTHGLIPPRFILFCAIGGLGLLCHLAVLDITIGQGVTFLRAQVIATVAAMAFNYVLNNAITYRSARLRGVRFVIGYLVFSAVCSLGALANISVANLTLNEMGSWPLAGVAGALMSSVFNFGVATHFVWRPDRRRRRPTVVLRARI